MPFDVPLSIDSNKTAIASHTTSRQIDHEDSLHRKRQYICSVPMCVGRGWRLADCFADDVHAGFVAVVASVDAGVGGDGGRRFRCASTHAQLEAIR
jgi:hypothetical protein